MRTRRRRALSDRVLDRWDALGWPGRVLVILAAVGLWVAGCLLAAALEGLLFTAVWGMTQ